MFKPLTYCCLSTLLLACAFSSDSIAQEDDPRAIDDRLAINRFASEPDLVTPTGIAVAPDGRVFVIECHTHFRPDDYAGPEKDRIRVFVDSDGDGKSDKVTTFFEGTTATMNVAFAPDGSLLVATRAEIFRLEDTDGDGVSDKRAELAHLETEGNYPHNGLSGFAFDLTGRIYFGFGENLGEPYELVAADGQRISGGGEGGSVFRINADGSEPIRWATGFWNPFHLAVDDFGRLFVVDNDPDWRPPCRLLHIVKGGDYGYRFSFGRRGTHPFTAWFGDVPDRLGMICGTGEAPSGLVSYRASQLPEEYRGDLIATSWGLHSIERFQLEQQGATWSSNAETIIKGGEDFRPVGVATASDGSLYISDWVKRSYPLHGYGRVWQIQAADKARRTADDFEGAWSVMTESENRDAVRAALRELLSGNDTIYDDLRRYVLGRNEEPWRQSLVLSEWLQADGPTDSWKELFEDVLLVTPSSDLLVALAQYGNVAGVPLSEAVNWRPDLLERPEAYAEWVRLTGDKKSLPSMVGLLGHEDVWLQQAAISRLAEMADGEDLFWDISEPDRLRIGLACVFARQDSESSRKQLPELLVDLNEEVRWVALRWIGEAQLTDYEAAVKDQLQQKRMSGRQFESILATLELLSGKKGADFEREQFQMLNRMAVEPDAATPAVRALSLWMLAAAVQRDQEKSLPKALTQEALRELAQVDQSAVAITAVRQLIAFHGADPDGQQALNDIASNSDAPASTRTEAIAGIQAVDGLLGLAGSKDRQVRYAALRSLAQLQLDAAAKESLNSLVVQFINEDDEQGSRMLARLLGNYRDDRPEDMETWDWLKWVNRMGPGNPETGEQVFFSSLARCGTCHQINGRGGAVGPDLSQAGLMSGERLLESILQPSREVSPRFTAWMVETNDGQAQLGLLQTERGGDQFYVDQNGESFVVNHEAIMAQQASDKSLMPESLLKPLTAREVRDLMAYLKQLQ